MEKKPNNKKQPLRILLKLSGEALMGGRSFGIDPDTVDFIAEEIKDTLKKTGTQMAVVIGGGNIFRGVKAAAMGMERVSADHMGMLATVINALALQNALEKKGISTRVQSAIEMRELAEAYIKRRAVRHLEKGRIVIFAAGTGNPYFTTDTAAALRAMEISAKVLLKATQVDGVYSDDPKTNPKARKFDTLTYMEVLNNELHVMDSTAISLCMDNSMPIVVFNLMGKGNIKNVVLGKKVGTTITGDHGKRTKKKSGK